MPSVKTKTQSYFTQHLTEKAEDMTIL